MKSAITASMLCLLMACVLTITDLAEYQQLDDHGKSMKDQQYSGHASHNTTCFFILSTPGSGSSTMVELLGKHCPTRYSSTCAVSGENYDAVGALGVFHDKVLRTEKEKRDDEHDEAAWRKFFQYELVTHLEHELVAGMLNPNNNGCWGFKEIRFGRGGDRMPRLTQDVAYLASLCENPKIILHTRRSVEKEFESSVLRGHPGQMEISRQQFSCFDTFVNYSDSGVPSCRDGRQNSQTVPVFRHHLEDYIERNENFHKLWEYLECNAPPPDSVVSKRSPG